MVPGMRAMKAAVIREPGGPEALRIETRPVPEPEPGEVLIRVRAFGLNRAETLVREGRAPGVVFPRIPGIEAVGIVACAPGNEFAPGEIVATARGGMGRAFDGGYAEYACVPATQVQAVRTRLGWETLGAIPDMLQSAFGALFRSLRLARGERLLIRGGTTAVGLAAAAIAKGHGAFVAATTRRPDCSEPLRASGADQVFIDTGAIAAQVQEVCPGGVNKVLELMGAATLSDSLRCARQSGIVCLVDAAGDDCAEGAFSPMEAIPTGVCLTTYSGSAEDFMQTPLDELAGRIARGSLRVRLGKVFHLDEIVQAHRCMEESRAGGKIVVLA